MMCPDCEHTVGWDCICPVLTCPCGAPMSEADVAPGLPEPLCPTCADLYRQAESKRLDPC